MQEHRALAIIKPTKNMTGEYSCRVESYATHHGDDTRSQYLQMIVPETNFYLNVDAPFGGSGNNLSVECTAKDIYPEPQLKILYVFLLFLPDCFNLCFFLHIYRTIYYHFICVNLSIVGQFSYHLDNTFY